MKRGLAWRVGVTLLVIGLLVLVALRSGRAFKGYGASSASSVGNHADGSRGGGGGEQAGSSVFANKSPTFVRRAKYFSGVDLPVFRLPEFQKFLETENRSPDALVAVYLLTNDESLLSELKGHTGNPEAMLCLAKARKIPLDERRAFARKYCELNPHQVQGYLVAASLDLEEGKGTPKDQAAFISLVHKGLNADEFSFGLDLAAENQRKALEFIGTDPLDTEAFLASANYQADEIMFQSRNTLVLASKMELAQAKNETDKVDVIKNYLSIAESVGELSTYSSLNGGEGRHIGLMNDLLDQLPPDAQLGDEWGKVEDLKKKLQVEWDEMMEDTKVWGDFLTNSPPEILDQFLMMRIKSGPRAAQAWLLEEARRR